MADEIKLPALGENVPGGDVVDIKVHVGDMIALGQELIDVEAEKSTVPVPSPIAGKVTKVLVQKGQKITTGQAIVVVDQANGKPAPPPEKPQPQVARAEPPPVKNETPVAAKPVAPQRPPEIAAPPAAEGDIVPAGPATRRLAHEWGVDLHQVPGSGPQGRVTQDDVKSYVRSLAAGGGTGPRIQAPPLPDFAKWGPVEAKPFESIRKKTADAVMLAWTTIPAVTQHDLADVTDIEAFRKQQEGKGPKLTVTAFVFKACAIVLKQFPQFNASLDLQAGQLILKRYYHLGVAVDTEHGLVVPVLRDVDHKSVHDIGKEMTEIAERPPTQAAARGHAGRDLHHQQPRRHRRHRLLAHRQLAAGRDPRPVAVAAAAGVHLRPACAAADAAAVAVVRSSRHRRRRRGTFRPPAGGAFGESAGDVVACIAAFTFSARRLRQTITRLSIGAACER